jgi:hypothetical protein
VAGAGAAHGISQDTDPPDGGAAVQPLLDELADALGALRVIQRSLAARPLADALDEDALLQEVIGRLTDVHQDLDRFSMGVGPMSAPSDDIGAPPRCAALPSAGPALRRSLRDIERRLEVAYATCVTAEQALLAQNCEHDREIALCLRWGVSDAISQQQHRLRTASSSLSGPADGSLEDDDGEGGSDAEDARDSAALRDDSVAGSAGGRPL